MAKHAILAEFRALLKRGLMTCRYDSDKKVCAIRKILTLLLRVTFDDPTPLSEINEIHSA